MKIGVTGTRDGMNELQRVAAGRYFLFKWDPKTTEIHHGDCVGVDVQFADMAYYTGFKTVCHPPVTDDLRGFHKSDEIRDPHTHFKRNRNIVNDVDLLVVIPRENQHQTVGGTWYTHDFALKMHKPVIILWPNGEIYVNDERFKLPCQ